VHRDTQERIPGPFSGLIGGFKEKRAEAVAEFPIKAHGSFTINK
jgi:hypothetical protein